jgi:transposase-like protein
MGDTGIGRRSAGQWRTLIERYERGSATLARFCEREGVAPSTFQYWRRRLREAAASASAPSAAARLVAVQVRQEPIAPAPTGLRLVLPSGVGIEVQADFDPATLRRVVEVLGARA